MHRHPGCVESMGTSVVMVKCFGRQIGQTSCWAGSGGGRAHTVSGRPLSTLTAELVLNTSMLLLKPVEPLRADLHGGWIQFAASHTFLELVHLPLNSAEGVLLIGHRLRRCGHLAGTAHRQSA